jgi:hypothetical protein
VGAILTATTHAEQTERYPTAASNPDQQLCPSGTKTPRLARCFNDAYVGAVDWEWRSKGGDWVTGGQATASVLENGPDRSVVDGTVIHPGDVGPSVLAFVSKEGGEHWIGDLQGEYESPKLDYTDLGFNTRGNDYRWKANAEWRDLKPWGFLRERHLRFEHYGRTNIAGLDIGTGYQLNAQGTLSNFWQVFADVHYRPRWFDDREVGDGTALERGGLVGGELDLISNPAKPVSFNVQALGRALTEGGGFSFEGTGGLLFRAMPQLDLEVLPTFIYNTGEPRYVESGDAPGEYRFGHLRAQNVGATVRATYTFMPRLTLQAFGQLFLASGHYSDFTTYTAPTGLPGSVVHLKDLRPYAGALSSNPDFETAVLNLNVVLRWEYALGSTLFLVYTRAQSPSITLAPGEAATGLRLGAIGRASAADVVMLKLTYFWAG